MEDVHRDLGKHDAEIETLKADVKEIKASVATILTTLSEARGGWKTLVLVGGVAGTMGAIASKVSSFLGFLPYK